MADSSKLANTNATTAGGAAKRSELLEAMDATFFDRASIRELADVIFENASGDNPNRIEALARSITLLADAVDAEFARRGDARYLAAPKRVMDLEASND